jgi:hypothetical protein
MNFLAFNININFRRPFAVVKLLILFRRVTLYFADLSKRNSVLATVFLPYTNNIT